VADNEKNAVIILDDGNRLDVQTTVEEIKAEIEGQKRMALALIKVVGEHGQDVWINANHVSAFYEYVPGQHKVAFGR
jgi:hypothetical protein